MLPPVIVEVRGTLPGSKTMTSYEHPRTIIEYPRSKSPYIPDEVADTLRKVRELQRVAMRLTWSAYLRDGALLERVASSTKTF
jgi:hypothetical protein